MRRSLAAALALASTGCGFGLMQTGRTVPAGSVHLTTGGGIIANSTTDANGLPVYPFVDLGIKVGITDRLEGSASGLYGAGGRGELKYALFPRKDRLAAAIRAGGGYAAGANEHGPMALVGGVASYDVVGWLVPYAGATWTTFWVHTTETQSVSLAANQSLATRTGIGDGLVQLAAGLGCRVARSTMLFVEGARWVPAQDDPGDGFVFVSTSVAGFGLQTRLGGDEPGL